MTKNIKAGNAHVSADLDDNKLKAGLKRLEARFKKFSGRIKDIGSRIGTFSAGFASVGTAAIGAFGIAAQEAGDFAEILSKFDTVFGDQSQAVRAWANEYGKAVGRSESQLLKFLGNAQDTFVPLGFDAAEAEKFSKQLTKLAIDLASFNNQTDQEAFDRLLSAVVGNTENLRAFGVVAQAAQIKAEALNQGFDPKNLSAYEKAQVIMKLAVEGTTAAQGDAIRTAGSYTNRLKALGASLTNLKTAFGAPLLAPLANILKGLTDIVRTVSMWAKANEDTIRTAAIVAASVLGIGVAGLAASAAIIGVGATIASIGTIAGAAFGAVSTAIAVLTSPITLVVAGIAGISVAVVAASGKLSELTNLFQGFGTTATSAWQGVVAAIGSGDFELAGRIAFTTLELGWLQVTQKLQSIWTGVSDFLMNTWRAAVKRIIDVGSSIYFGLSSTFDQLSNALVAGFDIARVNIIGFIDNIQTRIAKAIISAQRFFRLFSKEQAEQMQEGLDRDLERRANQRQQGLDSRAAERGKELQERAARRQQDQQQFGNIIADDFKMRFTKLSSKEVDAANERLSELKKKLSEQAEQAKVQAQQSSQSSNATAAINAQASAAQETGANSIGTFASGVSSRIANTGAKSLEDNTAIIADKTTQMNDKLGELITGGGLA